MSCSVPRVLRWTGVFLAVDAFPLLPGWFFFSLVVNGTMLSLSFLPFFPDMLCPCCAISSAFPRLRTRVLKDLPVQIYCARKNTLMSTLFSPSPLVDAPMIPREKYFGHPVFLSIPFKDVRPSIDFRACRTCLFQRSSITQDTRDKA